MKTTSKLFASAIALIAAVPFSGAHATETRGSDDPVIAQPEFRAENRFVSRDGDTMVGDLIIRRPVSTISGHGHKGIHLELWSPEGTAAGEVVLRMHQANRHATTLRARANGLHVMNWDGGSYYDLHAQDLNARNVNATSGLRIRGGAPTLRLVDTDERSAMVHVNSNRFHILRGCGADSNDWCQANGRWPMVIELNTNDVTFGRNVSASAFFHTSDERLKDNIEDLDADDMRERLLSLRPVSYEMLDTSSQSYGLIAQEVALTFPEIVKENEQDGMLSLDYGQLVAPVISVVGSLDAELREAREQNAEMKALIEELSARLTDIESRLE